MSWKNESQRHGMAARGIKTKYDEKELKMGVDIEKEHLKTLKRIIADAKAGKLKPFKYYQGMIAKEHLDEYKYYYSNLKKHEPTFDKSPEEGLFDNFFGGM